MDPEDDPLAAIRGLAAARVADELAEQSAQPGSPAEQARLAIEVLETRRPWSVEDRRVLGLPREADDEPWHEVVERRLREIDPVVVAECWLAALETELGQGFGSAAKSAFGRRTLAAATSAFGRLTSFSPMAASVRRAFFSGPSALRLLRAALSTAPVDAALVDILREALAPEAPREVAESALLLTGSFAHRAPELVPMIARRARFDRGQRFAEAQSALPLDERIAAARAASSAVLAEAIAASGAPALAPTALIELEGATSSLERDRWARTLVAVAGDAGTRYVERMRGRPGWSELLGSAPERAPDPLDDLLSPLADLRRAALETLAATPRPERLLALLLAAELDRYITRHIYRSSWSALQPRAWLPLLATVSASSKPIDRDLTRVELHDNVLYEQLTIMRAGFLLDELIDAGAARAPMPVAQELTPALRELAAQGPAAYAAAIATPPLTAEERAELDRDEAEVAASAVH